MAGDDIATRARRVLEDGLTKRQMEKLAEIPDGPQASKFYRGAVIGSLYRMQGLGLIRVTRTFATGGAHATRLPLGREVHRIATERPEKQT